MAPTPKPRVQRSAGEDTPRPPRALIVDGTKCAFFACTVFDIDAGNPGIDHLAYRILQFGY